MNKLLQSVLAVSMLLLAAVLWAAPNEAKPLVVVSFSGQDQFMSHLGDLARMGGQPGLEKVLESMLQGISQGRGLAGLDPKRPWGAVCLVGARKPYVCYGFFPITDLKAIVELAKNQAPLAEKIEWKDGICEIQTGEKTIFLQQKGSWTLAVERREDLADAPSDPEKWLGDLPKHYDLAVRLSVANAPKEYREPMLAQLRMGAELASEQMPGEGDEQHAMRSNAMKQAVQRIANAVEELKDVTLGWNTDSSKGMTHLDVEVTAREGTALADQFAQMKIGRTRFGGFMTPDAAFSACWNSTLTDADVAQARDFLAMLRKSAAKTQKKGLDEKKQKLAEQVLSDLFDVLEKTVETRKKEGGVMLRLDPAATTFVAGSAIAEGSTLEKVFKTLVKELQKDGGNDIQVKLDAETHEGVRFHRLVVPNPKPELASAVGETIEIVVGIGDDRAFVAAGRDAATTLKKTLDRSKAIEEKEFPPLRISVAATPIARFVAELAEEDEVRETAARAAESLEKAGEKSHVLITATPVAQGICVRIEVEEGLLKALFQFIPLLNPGMMPQGPQP